MVKSKNLTAKDLEDVSIWEDQHAKTSNKVINEIKIHIKCANEKQKQLKKAIEDKEITISIGPAGTGKTYIGLKTALHILKTQPQYRRIVLIKSLQTIKGEEMGFLPGTLYEKMEPYMHSFTGNLDKIFGDRVTAGKLMAAGIITIEPIAFIRGNTLDNSIVIIDETQNIDLHTFKTIVTRIGRNSKMVFLGDIEQVDRRTTKESCLSKVFNAFGQKDFVATVEFVNEECVRNEIIPLVLDILKTIE
jgi:phosphate starvation-inducible protein PhoH and related proteins